LAKALADESGNPIFAGLVERMLLLEPNKRLRVRYTPALTYALVDRCSR
jgi:hypothetical protein